MKQLFIISILFGLAMPVLARGQPLKLDVYSWIQSPSKDSNTQTFVLEVRAFVTNAGNVPVTLPTTTVSGGWSALARNGDSRTVIYSIGFGVLGTTKTKIIASPFRYFPVTLEPGEAAELPSQEFQMQRSDSLKRVTVVFDVQPEIARRFGWWSGTISHEHTVGKGENPFFEWVESDPWPTDLSRK